MIVDQQSTLQSHNNEINTTLLNPTENQNYYWSNTEKGKIAEDCINNVDPFEVSCWILLMKEAELRTINESRPFFERAMKQFPTCATFLKIYVKKELAEGSDESVEKLFQQYLNEIKDVELCELYMNWLKKKLINSSDYFDQIKKAYHGVILLAGIDYNACKLWIDYINHLKSDAEQGSFIEIQKVKELRELYYEAFQIPMNNLDNLWKEYGVFEQSVSRLNSDKIMAERTKDFSNSKRVAKDCASMNKGLLSNTVPVPPKNTPSEHKQKSLWIQWIIWEKNNPLGIEDVVLLVKRIVYVSEHYLMNFYFHPMSWCETLHYLQHYCWKLIESGDKLAGDLLKEKTRQLYLKAIGPNKPMCFDYLVNFSYAEFERNCNNNAIADETYEKLLKINDIDHSLVYINYMKHCKAVYGINEARMIFTRARKDPNITYEVFVCAANMEYFEDNTSGISLKIYAIALKRFASFRPFIESFLFHLTQLSDTFNIRLIFERILKFCNDKDKALVLLSYHRYVASTGDILSLEHIENRIIDFFDNKALDEFILKGIMSNKYCQNSMRISIFGDNDHSISLFESNNQSNKKDGIKQTFESVPSSYTTKNSELTIIPDLSQMRPFKPIHQTSKPPFLTPQVVPGGLFDAQPLVHELLGVLPSFSNFHKQIHLDIPLLFTYIENINSDYLNQGRFITSDPNNPAQHTFTKRINLQSLSTSTAITTGENSSASISTVMGDVYQARLNKKLSK